MTPEQSEPVPIRHARTHLSALVRRVEQHHERITITRNGRPAAVLMASDDLETLEAALSRAGRMTP